MMKDNHVVIMAGGIGSRFWPISTPERPKQFIDVLGCGKTLIQLTADRFKGICLPENIWVVTSGRYLKLVTEQLPFVARDHVLCEPCMRNTAPCIAYASWKIKRENPDATIVVTPSDHLIINEAEFQRVIISSLEFTCSSDSILTLGMKPTRPETGYGYIEAGVEKITDKEIHPVTSFKEKPDLNTAVSYVANQNFYWNSGLFIWNVQTIVHAIRTYEPEIAEIFDRLYPFFSTESEQERVDEEFPKCKNISIDYAVLERADLIFVFPADFGWSDLGTWGSLREQLAAQEGNACIGQDIRLFETQHCVVDLPDGKTAVIQGLEGYVIAEKEGRLLICKLSEEQRIKEFSQ